LPCPLFIAYLSTPPSSYCLTRIFSFLLSNVCSLHHFFFWIKNGNRQPAAGLPPAFLLFWIVSIYIHKFLVDFVKAAGQSGEPESLSPSLFQSFSLLLHACTPRFFPLWLPCHIPRWLMAWRRSSRRKSHGMAARAMRLRGGGFPLPGPCCHAQGFDWPALAAMPTA
jgi:hypothetical protein